MQLFIVLIILSVVFRRFIPLKGYLIDPVIEALTDIGESKTINLVATKKYVNSVNVNVIKPEDEPMVDITPSSSDVISEEPIIIGDEGIDLSDIKGKTYDEVDTSYLYGNFSSDDEGLADVVSQGLDNYSNGGH